MTLRHWSALIWSAIEWFLAGIGLFFRCVELSSDRQLERFRTGALESFGVCRESGIQRVGTLLEKGSLIVTRNLPFSQWDRRLRRMQR